MTNNLWHKITYLGVRNGLPLNLIRKVTYINRLLFIICLVGMLNFFCNYWKGLYTFSFLDSVITILAASLFYLNYLGLFKISFHILILFLNFSIFILSSLDGFNTGFFLFFFPLIAINLFLVGFKGNKFLIIYLSLTILLLAITIVTDYSLLINKPLDVEKARFLFWESLLSFLIFTGYGLFSLVDISEDIEKKLTQGKANLDGVFNGGLLNIIFFDREMKIKKFNESAKENAFKIFGKAIAVGDNFLDFVLKRDRRLFLSYFRDSLKGEMIKFEMHLKSYEHDSWYEIMFSPTYNDVNTIDGIIFSSMDVTEKKRMEISIQLAKKKADAANYGKSQFLSSISQEIRTPMNTVIGIAGVLLENNPRKDQVEKLKNLKSEAENFLIIINDILDLNRLETGNFELDESEFNLNHLVLTITSFISPLALEKHIELVAIYDENIPTILFGDSIRLSQIITNLIGNAIKHTDRGKIIFEVKQEEINNEYIQVGFSISDSGSGIAEDTVDLLFETYDYAYSKSRGRVGGSGLGLMITKKLLEFLNSTIFVESEIGKGSKFYFTIKFKNTGTNSSLPQGFGRSKFSFGEKKMPEGIHLLLVEDYLINQIVVTEFLSRWAINLDIADNGLHALEKVRERKYDIILMDLQMPEIDGYETTRMIRSLENAWYASVPIIAMTASPQAEIQEQVAESGMNDFITKPFEPEDLYNKILKHLENKNHST